MRVLTFAVCVCALLASKASACQGAAADGPECTPYWVAPAQPPGYPRPNMVVYDDGTGPAIWAVRSIPALVRKFDGTRWLDVPLSGTGSLLWAYDPLLLHDGVRENLCIVLRRERTGSENPDPSGYNLEDVTYRWTGKGWALFNTHPNFQKVVPVLSLPWRGTHSIFGFKYNPVNSSLAGICRWTGEDWETIGNTNAGNVYLCVFDDGDGPDLLAFGDFTFTQVNGVPIRGFAKWDGEHWSSPWPEWVSVGGQLFYELDDGSGPALYGAFGAYVNGVFTNGFGRWDGRTFSGIGGVVNGPNQVGGAADMIVWDDGTGPAIFIAGGFHQVTGGVEAHGLAKYQNGVWSACGGPGISTSVERMVAMDHARGPSLFLFGPIGSAGGLPVSKFVQYVGCPNCYANCDVSGAPATLSANDFVCFLTKFAAKDPYANCDLSSGTPAINAADFQCFLTKFATGCP